MPRLFLLNSNPGRKLQHWGIFLPGPNNSVIGTRWHITLKKEIKSCMSIMFASSEDYELKVDPAFNFHQFCDVNKIEVLDIGCPVSTFAQIDWAARECAKSFKYRFAKNNCQSFCIEVIRLLSKTYPREVPFSSVEYASAKAVFTVQRIKEKKTKKELEIEAKYRFDDACCADVDWEESGERKCRR